MADYALYQGDVFVTLGTLAQTVAKQELLKRC